MENGVAYYMYNNQQDGEIRMIKKRMVVDNDPLGVVVNIYSTEGIDNPVLLGRHYCVVYWVEPGEEFRTRIVEGWFDPCWNEIGLIPLRNRSNGFGYGYGFLNLEVIRLDSETDPGTSSGRVIVGRAKVPLPKELGLEKAGRFGLVRPDGEGYKRPEGHIFLSMKVKRLRIPLPIHHEY